MPRPGDRGVVGDHGEIALVLAYDLVDRRARACRRAMNPPIIRLAPSGIMATDCSSEIVRMVARPFAERRKLYPVCRYRTATPNRADGSSDAASPC